MKSLKDTINESYNDVKYINENETINEWYIHPTGDPTIDAILAGFTITQLVTIGSCFLGNGSNQTFFDFPLPFETAIRNIATFVENIRDNRKGKKLLKQLLKDKDVIDFLNLPDNKRTGKKWKELLQAKLSEDDYKWADAATRALVFDEKYGYSDKIKNTFYVK